MRLGRFHRGGCRKNGLWLAILIYLLSVSGRAGFGQIIGAGVATATPPGVYMDTEGNVKVRATDATQDLAIMRVRARASADAAKKEKISFISLPKLFARRQSLLERNIPFPDDLKYLGGLTQIRYVFACPDEKDLIVAGPAEPWIEDKDKLYAFGQRSGHPVMQLDDLISAFRTAKDGGGRVFGCAIDPSPDSVTIAQRVARDMAGSSRTERMAALQGALGPQKVRIFGTQDDTRLAFMCVGADYELKRFGMGLHFAPVAGLGNAVDNTRSAANKFWFEPSYEPLLVSADGLSFGIRGQRLKVKAGGFDFDPRGATPKAIAWSGQFTREIPALCAAVPLFAELQNIADESLLANLVRHDRLDRKVGWDMSFVYDDSACPVARLAVPKTCDTLVSAVSGSLACGGVMLEMGPLVIEKSREPDKKDALSAVRDQARQLTGKAMPTDKEQAIFSTP
jgi:hypothetical protein